MKANRLPQYGISLKQIEIGQEIESPYEMTITQSTFELWQGFIPSSHLLESSATFASTTGLGVLPLPFSFVMNLTLGLGVECFAESSILHLEIQQAQYLFPLQPGDTVNCRIMIEQVQPTTNKKQTIVTSWHYLFNQNDQTVFRLKRVTLFPRFDEIINEGEYELEEEHNFIREAILNSGDNLLVDNQFPDLERNDLILHLIVRPIGKSENLFWSTYLKNTHPIHTNYLRDNGKVVVSGGLVQAMVLGIAGRDIREALYTEIDQAFHINKVHAEDHLGAFTVVKEITLAQSDMEELHLRTIGLVNFDPEIYLKNTDIPDELFEDLSRPAEVEKICREKCPQLAGKIALICNWRILRKLPV